MGLSDGFEVDLHLESENEEDPIKLHITGVIKPIQMTQVWPQDQAKVSANPYPPKES